MGNFFAKKTFVDCSLLPHQRVLCPHISHFCRTKGCYAPKFLTCAMPKGAMPPYFSLLPRQRVLCPQISLFLPHQRVLCPQISHFCRAKGCYAPKFLTFAAPKGAMPPNFSLLPRQRVLCPHISHFCRAKGCYAPKFLTFAAPKGAMPPNFVEKTFANNHKTVKFVKVFSLESFPLYSILCSSSILGHGSPNADTAHSG